MRLKDAVVKIQSRFRGYREKSKYLQSKEAAVAIQRKFRRRLEQKQKAAQTIQVGFTLPDVVLTQIISEVLPTRSPNGRNGRCGG